MEIKEILKNGQATPESLMKDLENQIKQAQKEIAEDNNHLKEKRSALVKAAADYAEAVGLIDKSTDIDKAKVEKALISGEKNFKRKKKGDIEITTTQFEAPSDCNKDDIIIQDFIEMLLL